MNSPPTRNLIRISSVRTALGYAFGLDQPSLIVEMSVSKHPQRRALIEMFVAGIDEHLPLERGEYGRKTQTNQDDNHLIAYELFLLSARIQEAAFLPVACPACFATEHVIGKSSQASGTCVLAMPSLIPIASVNCFNWLVKHLNDFARSPDENRFDEEKKKNLKTLVEKIKKTWSSGTNDQHFIRAAYKLRIPVLAYPDKSFQYGWGANSRTMASSFTDKTPGIYIRMARDKILTNEFLRQGGISVPRQRQIGNPENLVKSAAEFGFPVVVKPADCDGGLGATSNIRSKQELLEAYDRAKEHSSNILLEEHIEGNEYRLLIVNGKLFWAHERIPAQVFGDGVCSVNELIERLNDERNRMPATGFSDIPIEITDEVLEVLQSQELGLDSIPPEGTTIRLARVPTVRTGGALRSVFDIIHIDNRKMAERAARLMRLDIAGIDYLTTDITRSWKETRGAITEINSRPQINRMTDKDIHVDLMKDIMKSDGRIPALLILGSVKQEILEDVFNEYTKLGLEAGVAMENEVRIGQDSLVPKNSVLENTRPLLLDLSVDILIVVSNGEQLIRTGLPVDRFDALVIENWTEQPGRLTKVLSLAKSHITGKIHIRKGDNNIPLILKLFSKERTTIFNSDNELMKTLEDTALEHAYVREKLSNS